MKSKLFIYCILLAITVSAVLGFSSNDPREKDLTKRTKGINPEIVYGPALDDPLSTLNESFEGTTFPPAGWIKLNPDLGLGWNRQTVGTTPIPGWVGGVITAPPGGQNAVAFCTWTTGGTVRNDQWLVTPQLTNMQSNDSLSFWIRWWPSNVYSDTLDIKISTTTPTIPGFTINVATLIFPRNSPDTNWTRFRYRIGNLVPTGANIYIAFRERVNDNLLDGASLSLDLVSVTGASAPISCTYGWANQTSTTTANFFSVSAVSNTVGWASAAGAVVRRTIDGVTWTNANPNPGVITGDVYNICGIDATTALCTTSPGATFIYRTTNGGTNWTQVFTQTGTGAFIDAIKMVDANTGYAMGDPVGGLWTFLKTTNGGVNWAQQPGAPTAPAGEAGWNNTLEVEGNNIWWVTNTATGKIYRSTNAGVNFTSVNLGVTTATYGSIKFDPNGTTGIATSSTGLAFRSTDAGTTWTAITAVPGTGTSAGLETGRNGTNIDFYAVRGTGVQRSTNSGATWTQVHTVTASVTSDISFAVSSVGCPVGWATGSAGVVAKNSIVTGVNPVSSTIPDSYKLSQNFPNPFNPTTNINFSIPKSGLVTMKVYDMLGKEVVTVVNEFKNAGNYIVGFNASNLPSGSYFYRIETNDFIDTKKMLLIK